MSTAESDLAELRRRLDEIDDQVQDLLSQRAEIVSEIGARKRNGSQSAHQPAREAEIIRRLIGRNGSFPPGPLVRMWRELLGATNRLQVPFAVAVYAPPEFPGLWDLARDHYGSHTPMSAFHSLGQVIRAVADGKVSAGVLPMPHEGDPDPWWRHLLSTDETAPRVFTRLPFGARGNVRSDGADALTIGPIVQQPTGQDRTFLATENATDISRGRFLSTLSALGLNTTFFASYEHAGVANTLIELDGFVTIADPRLAQFRAQLGPALHRLLPLGGYAVPLPAAAPASAATGAATGRNPAPGALAASAARS